MPSCFVKNCKNRTNVLFMKNVKFYSFPKDPELRIKWLEACQRDKDCKMKCERVCEVHFSSDCFEEQMTKEKLKRKLKAGSLPTELLQLPKKRQKRMYTNNIDNAGPEKSVRTAIPAYTELVEYATKETENKSIPERITLNKPEAVEDVSIEDIDLTHNTAIPAYTELVEYATKETENESIPERTTLNKLEAVEDVSMEDIDLTHKTVQDATEKKKPEEVLSKRFKALEKENEQLTQTIRRMEKDANIRKEQIATNILRSETLEKENKQLTQTIRRMEKDANIRGEQIATNILHSIFAPTQVKRIVSPQNRANWSIEDITSAIALRSVSARAYNYLREVRKIPLPCVSTLRRWISEFQVNPGILYAVLKIMQIKGNRLITAEKLTVLTFDEVYISNKIDIDVREQKIYGPHKTCQVVMARGLFSKWKQPIYYDFSKPMTKEILFIIIESLYKIGYTVIATISDMGPTNVGLWRELNIGISTVKKANEVQIDECTKIQCFFPHPSNYDLKIFVFADAPHLIKLLRNNFIDSGFIVDGKIFDKSLLEELLQLNSKDLKISFNLSREHLDAKGFQRQRVKLAAQVFSLRNAKSLEYCGTKGFLSQNNWQEMSHMLKTINNWFDVLNSQCKFGKHSGTHAYGVELKKQNKILDEMSNLTSKLRVIKKTGLLPFQKGILLTNESLKKLLPYLKEKYSDDKFHPQYIITRRLCQDILENFFSYLRAMGGANDHPSPVDFKNRLKWYVLGKHSNHAISEKGNTETDVETEPLIDLQDFHAESEDNIFDNMEDDQLTSESALFLEKDDKDKENEDFFNDE